MEEVDERRFLSILPEPGPGEDSREAEKAGESERAEWLSEISCGDGEERPAGEAERDKGREE